MRALNILLPRTHIFRLFSNFIDDSRETSQLKYNFQMFCMTDITHWYNKYSKIFVSHYIYIYILLYNRTKLVWKCQFPDEKPFHKKWYWKAIITITVKKRAFRNTKSINTQNKCWRKRLKLQLMSRIVKEKSRVKKIVYSTDSRWRFVEVN